MIWTNVFFWTLIVLFGAAAGLLICAGLLPYALIYLAGALILMGIWIELRLGRRG